MNRLASVLAGAATAAVSGAVIAAAAVGQGVFDGTPTNAGSTQDAARVATVAEPAEATPAAVQPQIVYVDKDPIYITRTVQELVAGSAPSTSTQPTATPTQKPDQHEEISEQPTRPAAAPALATPATVSQTGDDHEGSHTSTTPASGTTGRTSGDDD